MGDPERPFRQPFAQGLRLPPTRRKPCTPDDRAALVQRLQGSHGMLIRTITCPETAHLETIEYETSPVGMLIRTCSGHRSTCEATCPRTCAARLDKRDRSSFVVEVRSLLRGARTG